MLTTVVVLFVLGFVVMPYVVAPLVVWAQHRQSAAVQFEHVSAESFPPEVLSIRGRASISETDGVVREYAAAAHRYLGPEQAAGYLEQIDQPGTRMARIAVRPAWVGVLDFQTRLPSALGG